jgi:hypothetical protein
MSKKSKILFLAMTAMALTFGLVLAGCASWPTEGPSGTLTITGIPAEHEGKLVLANLLASNKEIARGNATAITAGEVKLPLYTKQAGYFGNDTLSVRIKTEVSDINVLFDPVPFGDGVGELKWDDQIIPGFITVTNFPAEFADNSGSIVYVGNPGYILKATVIASAPPVYTGAEASCSVQIANGIGTGTFWASENGRFRHFPTSGTRDVIVQLASAGAELAPGVTSLVYTLFEFKAAPIQDGRITLNLANGVKL